ncbi:unnamed protein product [Cyprideis torosa]|uniref:Biogenesis of lysosome-related organelles complex 1 subunit 7 n=1 Tax=Cyprideis torosa TaxID=163714 RepID=A0A7R8ZLT4_9CRUS|nr:unnamed protein product [Cyprideis torosa]CAG0887403.1 unnamed protein product [Cyprideis torosa]
MAATITNQSTESVHSDESGDTSLADKGEVAEVSPRPDLLADGIYGVLKPIVDRLDKGIKGTRLSQAELHQELDRVLVDLKLIADAQPPPNDFEAHISRLANIKRRVMVAHAQLANAKERLLRVQQGIAKEVSKRKAFSEPSPLTSPATDQPPPVPVSRH